MQMGDVCMMQNVVKYLFPNIFQKMCHSLIQNLHYTSDLIALVGIKFLTWTKRSQAWSKNLTSIYNEGRPHCHIQSSILLSNRAYHYPPTCHHSLRFAPVSRFTDGILLWVRQHTLSILLALAPTSLSCIGTSPPLPRYSNRIIVLSILQWSASHSPHLFRP